VDLSDSAAEAEFRRGLREWLGRTLPELPPPPDPADWPGRRAYDTGWQRRLYDAGYAGVHWPVEAGGSGASPAEHLIYLEETERAGAPYVGANFVGLLHAGPTIAAEGSPEQRRRYLPPILRGEQVWCQGFSEPGAGSDLAALRTRAVRDGDAYVVTGSKIWTSHAEVADWCELLVRTDPDAPRHHGISWLVLPMDAPGVTVRPLRTLAGTAEFAELFLDEVRIPVGNRVGAENDGWRVTMVTLSFERGTAFAGEVVAGRRALGQLARLARDNGAWTEGGLRRRIGLLAAEFAALWRLVQWNVSEAGAGGVPGAGASVFKLRFSQARQQLYDLAAEVLGSGALVLAQPGADGGDAAAGVDAGAGAGAGTGDWTMQRLQGLSYTIAAGTSQVQRDIVARRVLGLPRAGGS
jgi:alkylation response protein AidB-like acyl-CoA dehydrogenase